MKKNIGYLIFCAFLLGSCAKDIEMCIDGNMNPSEPGEYTYTWCGTNADHITWVTNEGTFAGESITLNFTQKSTYGISVTAENKKKDAYEYYNVKVGIHEARVEPLDCNGDYISYTSGSIQAYLYSDLNTLQTDLRNHNKASCLDSLTLSDSQYYNGTSENGDFCYNGGFTGVAVGAYFVYIQEVLQTGQPRNNLADLFLYSTTGNLYVLGLEWDGITTAATLSNASAGYFKNLISSTYLLTDVWINGTNTGVSVCNADDNIVFNLDGTWLYDVGADNCSGGQTNSLGTYNGVSACGDISSSNLYMSAASGSMSTASTIYVTSVSTDKIKVTMYEGSNTIEQEFTQQ